MNRPMAATLAAAAALLFAPLAQATVINSAYTPLAGTGWIVDFTVVHDGLPSTITNFTVDFPNFTGLVLLASPASWNSLLIQPDLNLPASGFLDSLAIGAGAALTGGSLAGFRVQFNYAGTPGALPFVISDPSFTVLYSGMTTVTAVPEPAAALLAALGLGVVGLHAARVRRSANANTNTSANGAESAPNDNPGVRA